MHNWSDEDVDWVGIDGAAEYIGRFCARWGRIPVRDYKEKWGTVRVYCDFGVSGLYWLVRPRYIYYRWPWWLKWTSFGGGWFWGPVSRLVTPWQLWVYRRAYKNAVRRWPHLRQEILACPDFPELLEGL